MSRVDATGVTFGLSNLAAIGVAEFHPPAVSADLSMDKTPRGRPARRAMMRRRIAGW